MQWHRIHITILKKEEWVHSGKILYQNRMDIQQSKHKTLQLHVWCQRAETALPFQFCWLQRTSLSGWFLSLYVALPGRHPTALVPPTSCGFQQNPGFIFTALGNGLSGPPSRDSPATHLASATPLNCGGRFQNPFAPISFPTLKPKPHGWCCQVQLTAWVGACSLTELHLHKLSFLLLFRDSQFFRPFLSQMKGLAGWGLAPRTSLPLSILYQVFSISFHLKPWFQC